MVQERTTINDGNPASRFRRGDDGALQCLVDDYGIKPDVATQLMLEAKTNGSAEMTI